MTCLSLPQLPVLLMRQEEWLVLLTDAEREKETSSPQTQQFGALAFDQKTHFGLMSPMEKDQGKVLEPLFTENTKPLHRLVEPSHF